jgi:hypothetical protein
VGPSTGFRRKWGTLTGRSGSRHRRPATATRLAVGPSGPRLDQTKCSYQRAGACMFFLFFSFLRFMGQFEHLNEGAPTTSVTSYPHP